MSISLLPDKLLVKVLSYLCGDDLIELSVTNQKLSSLCNCQTSWVNVLRQYKLFTDPISYNFPVEFLLTMEWVQLRSLYINAFKKWDWLIGFWKSLIPAFGGLLHVQMKMSPCKIVGYIIQAPPKATEFQTSLVPIFVINIETNEAGVYRNSDIDYLDKDGICCALYSTTEHYVSISLENEMECEYGMKMRMCCHSDDCFAKTDEFFKEHDIETMRHDFVSSLGMNSSEVVQAMFSGFRDGGIMFTSINMPQSLAEERVITPGFFAGDYAVHGSEILSLTYDSNHMILTKISGDRYVRCGAISILVDMTHPINYLGVLNSIARQPDLFNVKKILEEFQMTEDSLDVLLGLEPTYVDEALINILQLIDADLIDATFKDNESDGRSYVAAFKGRITLGMMPELEKPEYYYHDVLAVVTSQDNLFVFIPFHDEYQTGIRTIYKQKLRRLCFDDK